MAELINWHTAPLIIKDENGKRHCIPAQGSADIEGDFDDHPFVKKGWLSVDGKRVSPSLSEKEKLQQLRERYKTLFGKAAPSAAKAEKLSELIDEHLEAGKEKTSGQSEKSTVTTPQAGQTQVKSAELAVKK